MVFKFKILRKTAFFQFLENKKTGAEAGSQYRKQMSITITNGLFEDVINHLH